METIKNFGISQKYLSLIKTNNNNIKHKYDSVKKYQRYSKYSWTVLRQCIITNDI